MNRALPLIALFALAGCPKQQPVTSAPEAPAAEPPADVGVARTMPGPLAPHDFTMPTITDGKLKNGLPVRVVENHEVPLWSATLLFNIPSSIDPKGKEGLTSLLMDMLDEGAGDRDGAAFAATLKSLGASLSTWAGRDSLGISVSGPVHTREATLELLADVLLRPRFDEDAWKTLKARRIADLKASLEDPSALARRVARHIAFGSRYAGRLPTPTSLDVVSLSDLKTTAKSLLRPDDALLLVGGDVTLQDIKPVLEAKLAAWKARGKKTSRPDVHPEPLDAEAVYLVDKPSAQAVLMALQPVHVDPRSPDYWSLYLANTAFGGAFTSRLNMDLREDKGWTYGARCDIDDTLGDAIWQCSTNIQADRTVDALAETRKLIRAAAEGEPFTREEITYHQDSRIRAFAGRYETAESLLGELANGWLYGLAPDAIAQTVPGIRAVTPDSANEVWRGQIDPRQVTWVVVGDAAEVAPGLAALGISVYNVDENGEIQGDL